jgi:hypothetical protein
MGVWQGVAMDSLKCHLSPLCLNLLMAILGVAQLQDGWLAAIFYPFGHPMPYTYDKF